MTRVPAIALLVVAASTLALADETLSPRKRAKARMTAAHAAQRAGDPNAAIAALRDAVQIDPGFARAWSRLGLALGDAGQHAEAVEAHRAAARLEPAYGPYVWHLGMALKATGQLDEAATTFEAAIALTPRLPWRVALAGVRRDLGQHTVAIPMFDELCRSYVDFGSTCVSLMALYRTHGHLDEAIALGVEVVRVAPHAGTKGAASLHLGLTYLDRGELDLAIAAFDQALAIDPTFTEVRYPRGRAYLLAGKPDLAKADLEAYAKGRKGVFGDIARSLVSRLR